MLVYQVGKFISRSSCLFPAAKFLLETDQNVPNSVPAPQGHDLNRAKHLAWFRGNLENN